MTVITHLGLKRTALPDTFPHLIKLYISQDHDSSSLPSASSLTRNQEVKSSLGVPGAHFTPFFLEFFDYLAPSGFISFVSWRYLKVASKRERTGLIQPLPCSSSSPVLTEMFFHQYTPKYMFFHQNTAESLLESIAIILHYPPIGAIQIYHGTGITSPCTLTACCVFTHFLLLSPPQFIPMPVLYGVFLYMGVASLNGVQVSSRGGLGLL